MKAVCATLPCGFQLQMKYEERLIAAAKYVSTGDLSAGEMPVNLEEIGITAKLKPHQVEGVAWLIRRYLLGVNVILDMEDIDCPFIRNFVRVRVEVEVNRPLLRGFSLKREGLPAIWIPFKYERLNGCCFACGIVGHEKEYCKNFGSSLYKPELYGQWLGAGAKLDDRRIGKVSASSEAKGVTGVPTVKVTEKVGTTIVYVTEDVI